MAVLSRRSYTRFQNIFSKSSWRKIAFVIGVKLLIGLCVSGTWVDSIGWNDRSTEGEAISLNPHYSSRRLLATLPNCTPPAIQHFPKDLFNQEYRSHGAILVHVVVAVYMFIALALACDDYFVPSLDGICEALKIETDVAGATFMAAGSSAPELATAVIAVFIAKDDIGLGAVVGSAVFNIMFVISICALGAGMVVHLHWWPLFRDSAFYAISILALTLVILDEFVHWYEALILLVLYALYILLMYFNKQIEAWIVPKCSQCTAHKEEHLELINQEKHHSILQNGSVDSIDSSLEMEDENMNPAADTESLLPKPEPHSQPQLADHNAMQIRDNLYDPTEVTVKEVEDDDDSPLSMPKSICKRLLWFLSLPLILVMYITIPDCRKERWKRWFMVTFILSIVWISAFSYLLVWMIAVIGYTFGIPDTVMGLTFLAAGVSVPDAVASLIVVREGHGDMAVSNAVGSNVFDILLCLGLPWFLTTTVKEPGSVVQVYSKGLTYSSLTLLSTVVFLLVATHLNGWKLNKKYGIILMVVYVIFNVITSLYELNIFGKFHPPTCPGEY